MEEMCGTGPRSKRLRLEADEAERSPLPSQARQDLLVRYDVGPSRLSAPETKSAKTSVHKYHVVSHALTVNRVECREAWATAITREEKLYVHHFSQATWAGARVCAFQSSQESPGILKILCLMFSGESVSSLQNRSYAAGITKREWKYLTAFAACFLTNMGNYLAFGGIKIIPGIPEQKLDTIINLCGLQGNRKERLLELWNETKDKIYSLREDERQLGLPPFGISMYYHSTLRKEDIDTVQAWMAQHGVEGWNTKIWRREEEMERNGLPLYELWIASSEKLPTEVYTYRDKCVIEVIYGHFCEEMKEVVEHLERAFHYGNGRQRDMIKEFIEYFKTGSIDAHKRAQKIWVSVKDLSLETNIGFMETYRDPIGIRAEFEGFVAAVDKDKTVKYSRLAEISEQVLRTLPWPREFEKDVFHMPQFQSLTMISFANSSIPIGINLPNYEGVRREVGFKNIVLENILTDHENVGKVTFLIDGDQEIFKKRVQSALHIQIACHELLGHGSGKLFKQRDDGTYNYKYGEIQHPLTNESVMKCYTSDQTFDSVFGSLSATFEECRADCVGLYLSAEPLVLNIFGHTEDEADDVVYVNWLCMVRAGLVALEFFNPQTRNWSQPHMQARYALLRVLLRASDNEAKDEIDQAGGSSEPPFLQLVSQETEVMISLNRSKVRSVGLPALRDFLKRLQVYKTTADVDSARAMYTEISQVPDNLLALRRIVLVKKRPRPLLVQVNTVLDESCEEGVRLIDYPTSFEGVIASFVKRFEEWTLTC